jgi:hypothetical protein
MVDKRFSYGIDVDAGQAKRSAAEVRAVFERELAQIKTGNQPGGWRLVDSRDTMRQVQNAIGAAESEVAKAAGRAGPGGLIGKLLTGAGGMAGGIAGGLGALGIGLGARELIQQTLSTVTLGTQVTRTSEAFTILSGSAQNASDKLAAVKAASGGAIGNMQAMQIANKAAALGLANTAEQLSRVTKFATVAGRIMGMETGETLDNVAMAASNLSFRRLDQMGVSAEKTRKIFNELKGSMSESEAFLEAMLRVGEETFGGMNNSAVTAASGIEKLKARIGDLRDEAAKKITLALDPIFNRAALQMGGGTFEDQVKYLQQMRDAMGDMSNITAISMNQNGAQAVEAIGQIIPLMEQVNQLTADGQPGAAALGDELRAIGAKAAQGVVSPEMFSRLAQIEQSLYNIAAAGVYAGDVMAGIRLPGQAESGNFWYEWTKKGGAIPASNYQDPFIQRKAVDDEVAADKRKAASEAAKESAAASKRFATGAQTDWKRATEQMAKDFESSLRAVPGLFGTTQVTEEDMAAAKAGAYQPKADEYVRRLADEVQQKKDLYPDVDIQDAARRAGISGSLPPEVILAQFKAKWENQSLFANSENLGLINQDAVRRGLAEQEASKAGQQNLLKLFGKGGAPASGALSGASGGATEAGATGEVGGDLGPALKQQMADLAKDQTLIDGSQNVGKVLAQGIAAGWETEIGVTPWAAKMVAQITANVVAQFEAAK